MTNHVIEDLINSGDVFKTRDVDESYMNRYVIQQHREKVAF